LEEEAPRDVVAARAAAGRASAVVVPMPAMRSSLRLSERESHGVETLLARVVLTALLLHAIGGKAKIGRRLRVVPQAD
jgi:hypothetical protein